jgi:hypothetical protein
MKQGLSVSRILDPNARPTSTRRKQINQSNNKRKRRLYISNLCTDMIKQHNNKTKYLHTCQHMAVE